MLTNKRLKDFTIRATDGDLGTLDDLYFDDETWAIRYLFVDTGKWLSGRRVLISPISAVHLDWDAKRLDVALTKKQVETVPRSIPTIRSPGSTKPNTLNITDIPILGMAPICGARRSIRQAWFVP
jgi:PRC-barrel domain